VKYSKVRIGDEKPFSKEQTYWPLDLLPDVCDQARISVFGYDTTVAGYQKVNQDTLYQIADNFHHLLPTHRTGNTPIILIAHSLGGLVVKEVPSPNSIVVAKYPSSHVSRR
jgi:hypothetical protein